MQRIKNHMIIKEKSKLKGLTLFIFIVGVGSGDQDAPYGEFETEIRLLQIIRSLVRKY